VTSKGQITIPIDIQRYVGLQKGTPVELEVLDEDRFSVRFLSSSDKK
jgi:AbrB family looped-hinge helix DNA binding protein